MDITGIALGGLQAAQGMLEKSATRLAKIGSGGANGPVDEVDLSSEAVAVIQARQQFEANLGTMHTADDMQKVLLNLLA
jgi:flagellar hook protein FlgE